MVGKRKRCRKPLQGTKREVERIESWERNRSMGGAFSEKTRKNKED